MVFGDFYCGPAFMRMDVIVCTFAWCTAGVFISSLSLCGIETGRRPQGADVGVWVPSH